jgi:hypothetical protein
MPAHGRLVETGGTTAYVIDGYDQMPPFFLTVAGASDVWLFMSTTGGVTAGRRNAQHPVFPYDTEDKVADSAPHTGGFTTVSVHGEEGSHLWQPFAPHVATPAGVRSITKSVLGDEVTFSETHPQLQLTFSVSWRTSTTYGVVRRCVLASDSTSPRRVEVVDGLLNLLPPGTSVQVQRNLSNLLDAYKLMEVDPDTGLGTAYLNSRLTDLAEPAESLAATTVWQVGLPATGHHVSAASVPALREGQVVPTGHRSRGERAAYLVRATVDLPPRGRQEWTMAADVDQDAAQVVDLREDLRRPRTLLEAVEDDLAADRRRLRALVAGADGLQCTGELTATAHHQANVLFNIMRGGVFADGYRLDADDVVDFVRTRRRPAAEGLRERLPADADGGLTAQTLVRWAEETGDPDLVRLTREYLPLTFSRRHGDPSRPWNVFDIVLTGPDGRPRLDHQGNWRDIFQNWEALAWSYPGYLTGMISTFVDATTVDGYNPYRISRAGIDWEVPEPEDPWANIGYWSDHQVVYLLALLETSDAFEPGRVAQLLDQRVFTYADVPYRLAGFEDTLADPSDTVTFDDQAHAAALARAEGIGGDGLLLHDRAGELVRATLTDKLLLLLAAKLVNLVPRGGIWMNTQRPEWNDANNALVGHGLSVVTVAYLHRYVGYLQELLLAGDAGVEVGAELAGLLETVTTVLSDAAGDLAAGWSPARCRQVVEELGRAGESYRTQVYAGVSSRRRVLEREQLVSLLATARTHLEDTVRSNAREDGLFHAYNTLSLDGEGLHVHRLAPMLEGQVAVLSSGMLDSQEAATLVKALRESPLHRADQHSYQLYPDVDVPTFFERNTWPAEQAAASTLLPLLHAAGERRLAVRDRRGAWHFGAGLSHAGDVTAELERLADDPRFADAVAHDRALVLDVFEQVFDHRSFTGRSGTFFAFEGLGSIYWHMVSKLLLGVQRAVLSEPATPPELLEAYEDVRHGLGYCKDPQTYGAFPTDPYSHTPAGRGARQPGMTGQVKEEVITRFAELGARVRDGCIMFDHRLLRETEWLREPARFDYLDTEGRERTLRLPAGSLAFTWCQVPFVLHRTGGYAVRVTFTDGRVETVEGAVLPREVSAEIFSRTGRVESVELRLEG